MAFVRANLIVLKVLFKSLAEGAVSLEHSRASTLSDQSQQTKSDQPIRTRDQSLNRCRAQENAAATRGKTSVG